MSLTCRFPIAKLPPLNHTTESEDLVHQTIHELTEESKKLDDPSMEDSFFVCDLSILNRQYRKWQTHLGFVKPHYAVKCNNDAHVLRVLAQLGCNFDCASYREIEQVLSMDVDPGRIIYANTVKNPSYIRWARDRGVKRMTVDNEDELYKISECAPHSELLLRIITDDTDAVCPLSCKFGAPLDSTTNLLALSKQLGLKVVGVAFHIGSGGGSVDAYPRALRDAAKVFAQARSLGISMSVVDIGGGFEDSTFERDAKSIRDSLAALDLPETVEIVAEPGRFMVADAFTLASAVIGRRETTEKAMLYITDGCYANLNCIIYDHQTPVPVLLNCENRTRSQSQSQSKGQSKGQSQSQDQSQGQDQDQSQDQPRDSYVASVWGPTCDGIDCITTETKFPRRVKIGDWIYFKGVGAYTLSASTTFNGFNFQTRVHYVCSKSEWVDLST